MIGLAGNRNFRFALCFSLAFHLLFLTSVEGAVFLNRALSGPKESHFYIDASSFLISPEIKTEKIMPPLEVKKETPKLAPAPALLPKIQPKNTLAENFSKSQTEIDQKIEKIREQLDSPQKEVKIQSGNESLVPRVSDIEKVPLRARESLTEYLKRMRSSISGVWIEGVENESGSGVLVAQYKVDTKGNVFGLKTLSLKGTPEFEALGLLAIHKASPFGPLPFVFLNSEKEKYLTIELTFYLERSKNK